MKKDFPSHLKHNASSSVLKFLSGTSSHSDLSEFFLKAVIDLKNAETFTPADRPFAYYLIYANTTEFGFCESMRAITFRLPKHLHADAISNGARPHSVLADEGWFDFPAFGSNSKSDHGLWAGHAYKDALL